MKNTGIPWDTRIQIWGSLRYFSLDVETLFSLVSPSFTGAWPRCQANAKKALLSKEKVTCRGSQCDFISPVNPDLIDWWIFGPGMWRHVCIRHLAHARKKSIGTGLFGPCPRCPRPKEMSCRACNVASFWHFVLFCQLNPNPSESVLLRF